MSKQFITADHTMLWGFLQEFPFPVSVKSIQDNLRFVLWNQQAEKLWGLASDEVIGKRAEELSDEGLKGMDSVRDAEIIRRAEPFFQPQTRSELPNGEEIWLQSWFDIIYDQQGQPQWLVCVYQDVTEAKKSLDETLHQKKHIQSISDNAPGILFQFRVDADNRQSFSYISRKFLDIFGMDPQEIMGRPEHMFELLHPDDRAEFFINLDETIKNRSAWKWQGRMLNSQGQVLHIEAHSNPYQADDGCMYWDGMFQDQTFLKEKERQLREQSEKMHQAARLVSIGEMAGGVAHEINTPLGAIAILSEVAEREMNKEACNRNKVVSNLRQINDMVFRISKIIKAMRSYARKDSDEQHESASVHCILDEVLSVCNHRLKQEQVKIQLHGISPDFELICHPTQISQVLLNLINNSCDAIRKHEEKWIRIEACKTEDHGLEISLMDSGNGIPADIAEKLFENFFTTKGPTEGTGLGLSMSRNIMKSHAGDLCYDRSSAHTRFVLKFPASKIMAA